MAEIGVNFGGGSYGSDDCNAVAGDILTSKTAIFSGSNDEPVAGTMPNNGAQSATLNCGQSKTIPAGYTSGGTVVANSLASQTSATANANQMLAGTTAWVNGALITGTIPTFTW